MDEHEKYMRRCLELASQGLGHVAPNPMVGCVLVHNGQIVSEGAHEKFGEAHAEVNAINSLKDKDLLKELILYVNLEPCSHQGKTPPCTKLILEIGIRTIVIGTADPNPIVNGAGIVELEKAGCKVIKGILEKECIELNRRYFCFYKKNRPWIILKWAQTADGFIDAERTEETKGKPLKISNADSRKRLHQWRSEEQAIMIGTNTALLDNPMLTVRDWNGKNPLRIVPDKWLRIPSHYHLFDKSTPTLVFTAEVKKPETNLEFACIDFEKNIPEQMLQELKRRNIHSLIIEGGEQLLSSFINQDLWDGARVFTSSKKLGKGVKAPILKAIPKSEETISGDLLQWYRRD